MAVDGRAHLINPYMRRQVANATNNSNTTFVNAGDLDLSLPLGLWRIKANYIWQSAATNTGIQFDYTGSTLVGTGVGCVDAALAVNVERRNLLNLATAGSFNTSLAANTPYFAKMEMTLNVTTAGIFRTRFRSSRNLTAVQLNANSWIEISPIPAIP